ncbi:hypothetical protein N7509_004229 [Penicillium cosmopolitanum]|uniref:Uncharacterized protein n=1 Tax=Penicillium cosmopolitanum TaxID=1131564 RepID=A0A9W9W6I0_9EURO|nr:uncharacterized protein N7509_004229 [Penicillium cosmopolitanum]KAJ5404358.1 hypothetical protein N7509_004229 [Penicillium cosmopolitanum]
MSSPGQPSRVTKWWPISFFIAAIVCFIIGGALIGVWTSNSINDCSYSSYSSYYYSDYSCVQTDMGEFWGGVAMFVIGGVCKLIAWVLLIIFCVKRSRNNHTTVTYVNHPPAQQQQFQQPYAAPQPVYAPSQQSAQFPHSPASPGPMYPEMANPSLAGTPPPKEAHATATAFKYCSQCGTAISSRFCPQCGIQA